MFEEKVAELVAWPTAAPKFTMASIATNEVECCSKLANLSYLAARLKELETKYMSADHGGAGDARLAVVDALEHFRASRFRLGEKLAAYRQFFVAEQSWMEAAQLIANAMGRNERTIRRMVEGFQRASKIPSAAIMSMERHGIDPAARKNAATVARLLSMPSEMVESNPDAAVSVAVQSVNAGCDLEVAKPKRVSLTAEERQRLEICTGIRAALAKVTPDQKLSVLMGAVEELSSEWGYTEPVSVIINPRAPEPADDRSHEQPHLDS